MTTTLPEFLLARYDELAAEAQAAAGAPAYAHYGDTAAEESWQMAKSEGCAPEGYRFHRRHDPAYVLADIAAKRQIVELATNQHTRCVEYDELLPLLAVPFSDHEEWREEWRP